MGATLVLAFRSFTLAGIVALIGVLSVGLGMLSLWLAGWPLGFNPILGSAGLVGVAINASIVVLAAIRADVHAAAGDVPAITAAVTGATRHIVATTLTTVGGFMPLILLSGGEFWPPRVGGAARAVHRPLEEVLTAMLDGVVPSLDDVPEDMRTELQARDLR
jgi:multidrug efflux pump